MSAERPARNFRRLVGYVFHYWGKLSLGIGFSFLVALFHVVSLGSLVPFFETLFPTGDGAAVVSLSGPLKFLSGIQEYLAADRQRALFIIAGFLLVVFLVKGVCRFLVAYLI